MNPPPLQLGEMKRKRKRKRLRDSEKKKKKNKIFTFGGHELCLLSPINPNKNPRLALNRKSPFDEGQLQTPIHES